MLRFFAALSALAFIVPDCVSQPPDANRQRRDSVSPQTSADVGQGPNQQTQRQQPQSQDNAGGQGLLQSRQRNSAGQSDRSARGADPQRQGSSRGDDPRKEFTQNAMRFDLNGDSQLAAHELRNLFVVLTTQMQVQQQQFNPSSNQNGLRQPSGQNGLNGLQLQGGSNSGGSGGITGGGAVAQGSAIRQAIFIFLQLVMQFDANGDGLLSQAELNQFADALLRNDLSLVGAASSAGGRGNAGRGGSVGGNSLGGFSNGSFPSNQIRQGNGRQFQQQQQQSVTIIQAQSDRGRNGGRTRDSVGGDRRGNGDSTTAGRSGPPASNGTQRSGDR